jgi:hypothetical protein
VVVRRGQIRRIMWVSKTLEAHTGQFLLGCKYPWAGVLSCKNKTPLVTFCMYKSSWMMDPTRSREMSSCSATDLAQIRRCSTTLGNRSD